MEEDNQNNSSWFGNIIVFAVGVICGLLLGTIIGVLGGMHTTKWLNTSVCSAEENCDSENILNAQLLLDFRVNTFTTVEENFGHLWL